MKNILYCLVSVTVVLFLSCSYQRTESTPMKNYSQQASKFDYEKNGKMFFLTEHIFSPSLKNNKLDDPINQPVRIFLPLSYYSSQKKYPVVYYLHGFGSSFLEIEWYRNSYKKLMIDNTENEFILVGVNGRNKYGGSFYVNSVVTGNWEDYVINDVVNYVDSKYRTIPKASARGIAGFSMGGFGCINVGFKHSDKFSCLFAISPAIIDEKGIQKVLKSWSLEMVNAYGTAFAPNVNNPYLYMDFPKFDNSRTDNETLDKWKSGIGNMKEKVNKNINSISKLRGIQIEYGTKDLFDWIPVGCKLLSNILNENNMQNKLVQFEGNHGDKNNVIFEKDMGPYFLGLLKNK